VQAFPSEQPLPFGFAGCEQAPVAGSQVPATWHWSSAEHTIGLPPTHAPAWHASVRVQVLLSLHAVPFATDECVHEPEEHASVVQGLLSSHDPQAPSVKPSSYVTRASRFTRTSRPKSAPGALVRWPVWLARSSSATEFDA